MAINVNRVVLGFNVKNYDTAYFTRVAKSRPASSTPLGDGSFLICKAGGLAWFVAPLSTQIVSTWCGSSGVVSAWGNLSTCLSNRGYTPTDWFVPDIGKLQNPGYICRTNWGTPTGTYWSTSSSPYSYCTNPLFVNFADGTTGAATYDFRNGNQSGNRFVRAFRCVTY